MCKGSNYCLYIKVVAIAFSFYRTLIIYVARVALIKRDCIALL